MAEPSGSPISKVTKLSPKTLMIIAVVGVGGGLIWRKFSTGKAAPSPAVGADGSPVDVSKLALQGSSAGNLGTTSGVTDDTATRDVGSITLPVVSWVVTIGGRRYLTDGTTLELIDTVIPAPTGSVPIGSGPGTGPPISIPENTPPSDIPKEPVVGYIHPAPVAAVSNSDVPDGWQLQTDGTMKYIG